MEEVNKVDIEHRNKNIQQGGIMETERQLLESMGTEALLNLLKIFANEYQDGHYTIMSFTTGYKIMFGTPDLDSGKGRDRVNQLPIYQTMKEALVWAILVTIKGPDCLHEN